MTDQTNISPPALTLPAALLSEGFSLRMERDGDAPFLLALYSSTREDELAQAPWSPEQKSQFLAMQFNAQRTHYRAHMPDCQCMLLIHDGAPVGRIYLDWGPTTMNLVDIALIPQWRGRGFGTKLMRELLALADRQGKITVLFVERYNPASRLYRRLGFVDVRDTQIYLEMERPVGG